MTQNLTFPDLKGWWADVRSRFSIFGWCIRDLTIELSRARKKGA